MMRKILTALAGAALVVSCCGGGNDSGDKKMDKFVNKLMSKMTLEEKIGQLNLPGAGDIVTGQAQSSDIAGAIERGEVGGLFNIKGVDKIREVQRLAVENSRLGIPLIFGMDVIHGYETVFPIPLGMAASWDPEAVERASQIAAVEASAAGICWTFSPMVDVSRDPRWGRVAEGVGEDPYLGGEIGAAMVRGYQGDNSYSSADRIMSCVKHYALYGASEAGRDYNTVDMGRQRMYNEYFGAYKRAIEAGAGSVMASFNEVEGVPATANKWLMTDVLRDQWGFDGFVVTDYTGISEMIAHGIGDLQEVSARALQAGVDMDMVSEGFLKTVKKSIDEGRVTEKDVDIACRRILEAKYKLGLFDDPYRFCDDERAKTQIYTPEHRAEARRIAAECFVLLKNDGNVLPISKKAKIAVVGTLASSRANMPGTWSVATDLNNPATVVEGLRSVAGDKADITYVRGSNICTDKNLEKNGTMFGRDVERDTRSESQMRSEAVAAARRSDVVVAVLGEASEMSGESSSRADIGIPDTQRELLEALVATGKPVVLVLFAGRPMTIQWESENVPAILNVWFGGSEAAYAIADVLFGDVNPSGKLPSTFPRSVGQIPVFYNHKNTGRPLEGKWFQKFRTNYLDIPNEPTYAFGYGLSYTTFEYSPIRLSKAQMTDKESIKVSVDVKNTGNRAGAEVVQLYVRDLVGSVTRPVQELKGFKKVALDAGQTATVEFEITPETLSFYNYDLDFVCEKGEFDIMVGGSSDKVESKRIELI